MRKQTKLPLNGPRRVSLTLNLPAPMVKTLRALANNIGGYPIPLSRLCETIIAAGLVEVEKTSKVGGAR